MNYKRIARVGVPREFAFSSPEQNPQLMFVSRERIFTFLVWGAWVGLAFLCIYPTTNWLAGFRPHHYRLFVMQELGVPFVPAFVWAYLSMYVLFLLPPFFLAPEAMKRLAKALIRATCVAGVVFLVFPARLGFPRILPDDPLLRSLFATLFAVDPPYNLVPSLHVTYSTAIVLTIAAGAGRKIRILLFSWLALIMASTLFIHQHHLLDVFTGWALALLVYRYGRRKHA